ncbi:MAG: chromate transporter, partial [Rhizobiales bacterium]|nr:chromate transporter [Hyphomicrobiales bacterium]
MVVAPVKDTGLSTIAVHFALLSLLAFGGVNAVVPEMHRQAVEVAGWMTDRQFADMFAIAQLAPGPNMMIVAL